jgi:transposase
LVVGREEVIVAESLEGNVSIRTIARKHGIGTGQLYNWRRQFLSTPAKAASFARVELVSESPRLAGPVAVAPIAAFGLIEIVLPGGATVRVDARVEAAALRCVLGVLRG